MVDSSNDRLKRLLAKDENYTRFKEIIRKFSMSDVMEELMSEIDTLHATRKGRKLYRSSPNPRDVIEVSLQDSSFRSRAVEIMMRMMKSQKAIEKAIDANNGYLMSQYSDYIEARTKAERERILRSINRRAYEYQYELEGNIEVIKEFINDCDKMSYSLKNTIQAIEIMYRKETVINHA